MKCRRWKTVKGRRCADFVGGRKGVRGQPGKKCRRFERVETKVCSDFGKPGHGKLPKVTREKIRKSIHKGSFGGKGTFSSLNKCKSEVDKQKARGMDYSHVSKRINLIRIFRKNMPDGTKKVADDCWKYAKQVYGRE